MKKLGRIALLLIVLFALILFVYFLIVYDGRLDTKNPLAILALVLWSLFMFQPIFYSINVFRNTTVAKDQRFLWILSFYFLNFLATTFYWYRHIWHDDDKPKQKPTPTSMNTSISKQPMAKKGNIE